MRWTLLNIPWFSHTSSTRKTGSLWYSETGIGRIVTVKYKFNLARSHSTYSKNIQCACEHRSAMISTEPSLVFYSHPPIVSTSWHTLKINTTHRKYSREIQYTLAHLHLLVGHWTDQMWWQWPSSSRPPPENHSHPSPLDQGSEQYPLTNDEPGHMCIIISIPIMITTVVIHAFSSYTEEVWKHYDVHACHGCVPIWVQCWS